MSVLYCDSRISKKALNRFLAYYAQGKDEVHTFSLYHNDNCMIRLASSPYDPSDKREIYSLSKSFCSTAIGMLVDDGRLSLDDRIVDLFAEYCPNEISENLSKMKLRHVLSMNTGHEKCVMPQVAFGEDAIREFLNQPVEFTPGTHFTYNTGATCLLSCLVTKVTGESLLDFLTRRLFLPLGINDVRWNRVCSGYNEGGCGIHVSNDDIAKLGLLYLHKGVYNGKRLLSEKWVAEASSPISDNSSNGSKDWCSGYGFQFWVNAREGFRGDGAFGQLCLILPERNMVVAVQSELNDFQTLMDRVMEFVEHLYDKDDEKTVILHKYSAVGGAQRTSGLENTVWNFDKNPIGWTTLRLSYHSDDDSMHAIVSDGCDQYDICAGNGEWKENTVIARRLKPKLVSVMPADEKERCRFVASYTAEENYIHMAIRYLNCPHRMFYDFSKDGNGVLHLDITPRELLHNGSSALTAREIN